MKYSQIKMYLKRIQINLIHTLEVLKVYQNDSDRFARRLKEIFSKGRGVSKYVISTIKGVFGLAIFLEVK